MIIGRDKILIIERGSFLEMKKVTFFEAFAEDIHRSKEIYCLPLVRK